jgi:hypothetical protein
VPTAVRIRPETVAWFPEVLRGLPRVARPYLYTRAELADEPQGPAPAAGSDLALTPGQFARQLGVEASRGAALGAILFPEIRDDETGTSLQKLEPFEVERRIRANLFGGGMVGRPQTLFEQFAGAAAAPSGVLARAVAARISGFRVVLGRKAYDDPASASRLLDAVCAP